MDDGGILEGVALRHWDVTKEGAIVSPCLNGAVEGILEDDVGNALGIAVNDKSSLEGSELGATVSTCADAFSTNCAKLPANRPVEAVTAVNTILASPLPSPVYDNVRAV